jgi:hypothetical protein
MGVGERLDFHSLAALALSDSFGRLLFSGFPALRVQYGTAASLTLDGKA